MFCLSGLTLTHVPDDVTAVSVEMTNLHSAILLNGSMTDELTSETFSLTQGTGENADTWSLASGRMLLPVDASARRAVVRTKNNVSYTAPAAGASEADWLAALTTAMASVEKPANAIGEWRIPTYDEALIFASNPAFYPGQDKSYSYFCLTDNVLEWLEVRNFSTTPEAVHATNYVDGIYLRPVITISY